MKLNLTATNKQEELVKAYLEENASEILAEKINNGTPFEKDGKPLINKKTLAGFMKYACGEAKKLAEKGAISTYIDDSTVFGWAIHYFEEEKITEKLYNEDGSEYKPKAKSVSSANVEKPKEEKDIDLFDMASVGTSDACDATEKKNEQVSTLTAQPKKKLPKGVSKGQISFFDFGD